MKSTCGLQDLFNKYGSDKSINHAYHVAYELLCSGFLFVYNPETKQAVKFS